jgi:hypothetical protein
MRAGPAPASRRRRQRVEPLLRTQLRAQVHQQLVARDAEQIRAERHLADPQWVELREREERRLRQVLGRLGHLRAKEPRHAADVPLEQRAALRPVATPPRREQRAVVRRRVDPHTRSLYEQLRSPVGPA